MSERNLLEQFDDELAAARRQLRRLEKLAIALKRQQRKHPRRIAPLFRLRQLQRHLAACEEMLRNAVREPTSAPDAGALDGVSTAVVRHTAKVIYLPANQRRKRS